MKSKQTTRCVHIMLVGWNRRPYLAPAPHTYKDWKLCCRSTRDRDAGHPFVPRAIPLRGPNPGGPNKAGVVDVPAQKLAPIDEEAQSAIKRRGDAGETPSGHRDIASAAPEEVAALRNKVRRIPCPSELEGPSGFLFCRARARLDCQVNRYVIIVTLNCC